MLTTPTDFLVGSDDLLDSLQRTLQGRTAGAKIDLHLEPEDAFGDYDELLVFLEPRSNFSPDLTEGTTLDSQHLADFTSGDKATCQTYTVTELYPDHVVLDGNHPLCGIALHLSLKVELVRKATPSEVAVGTCGNTFFTLPNSQKSGASQLVEVSVAPTTSTHH